MHMNKVGRNDPCPCGSGKKYKHCHQLSEQGGVAPSVVQAFALPAGRESQLVSQGNALQSQGRLEEAAGCYRQAIAINPGAAELHSNLGNLLDSLGERDGAVASYRKALSLKPDVAAVHSNLGLTLQAQGKFDEAIESYGRAITLQPDYAGAHFNLGLALQAQGRHADAAASYRRLLALRPDYAQGHNNLGAALEAIGSLDEAVASYRKAIALDPALLAAQNGLASALGRLVPLWHVPMMNDGIRNEAYYAALRAAVTPESHVFEIGTGSGLLAMMAARLGAKSVTTCEAEPLIAATARRIIADNGLDARITLLAKKSTDVNIGADMAQPADVMVSEILSSELLGERVLASLEDARRRLLAPGCRIIPGAGSIMIALFGGEDIAGNLAVGEACGFDLRHFNSIVPRRQTIARSDLAIEMLSADTEAFRFDFAAPELAPPESKLLRIPVTAAGRCHGIIQWIRLEMIKDIVFENHPAVKAAASGWTRCAYVFGTPLEVRPGQVLRVSAAHNRVFPWFELQGID